MDESVKKRSMVISGHSTSISLEDSFWHALQDIARERGQKVPALVAEIDTDRTGSLSSAIRVYVLNHFRKGSSPDA